MRLCVDGRFLVQDVTGVQRVALEFVLALDRLMAEGVFPRLTVDLLVPARGELVLRPTLGEVRLQRVGRMGGHAWEQLELPRFVGRDPLLCLGNVAPVRALLARRTSVYTMVHDLSYKYFPTAYSAGFRLLYGLLMPVVLQRSARIFTVSESERHSILFHCPRVASDRIVAVQNGGGEGAEKAIVSGGPGSLAVGNRTVASRNLRGRHYLYVGSLTRRKNAENLVAAAARLLRADGDATFTFVGATNASFEGLGLRLPHETAPRMRFLGQVNDRAVIEAQYRRAAVLVFPSLYEASPLPPTEAMRFGCPVVAADIPSLRERCAGAAIYCDPHDVGSIVDQVQSLVGDDDLWQLQQKRGLEQAGRFSWETQVRQVLDQIVLS